jgi:transcriptional regulator with XRE-family HTH domain
MMQESLAHKIRVLRAERGLTLREAASLTGVAKETINDIERGIRHPHDVTLAKLARGYEVPVEDLLEEPALPLTESPGGAGHQVVEVATADEPEEGLAPRIELGQKVNESFDAIVAGLRAEGFGDDAIREAEGMRERMLELVAGR